MHAMLKAKTETVSIVSPVKMHKHFGMRNLDYEERKEFSENQCMRFLSGNQQFMNMARKHDIADAVLMCKFYCNETHDGIKTKEQRELKLSQIGKNRTLTFGEIMNKFRFVPSTKKITVQA